MKMKLCKELIKQIDKCFLSLDGNLLPTPKNIKDRYQWLHEKANYCILAHDNSTDPLFIYANKHALSCFKYTWDEILALPSRLSTSPINTKERERLIKAVTQNEIVYNYSGERVDKHGNTFIIYDGIVWELKDRNGNKWGQAALFWKEEKK